MPNVKFNRFYRYAELTRILKAYAKEYPALIRLESIGKSHEGRDVWLITATNFKSGIDAEKPAFWVDGNIHRDLSENPRPWAWGGIADGDALSP